MFWITVSVVLALVGRLAFVGARRQRRSDGGGTHLDVVEYRDDGEAMRSPGLSGDQEWAAHGGEGNEPYGR